MNKISKNEKGFSAVELVLVIVIIALIGVVGWFVCKNHHKALPVTATTKTTSVKVTKVVVPAPIVDTWNGGGTDSNWSDSTNWSNGIPKSNYSLVFNLAPNTSSGGYTSNNDITGLSLNNITFKGGTPNAHGSENISLTGNQISLSNGIVDTTQADVSSSIAFGVSLTSNQTFNLNGNLGFVPGSSSNLSSTNLNVGNYTLTIAGNNGVSFNYLSGSGTLVVNPSGGNSAVIGVGQPSPNFSGLVKVESGLFAVDFGSSLGTATINVSNGGTLRFVNSQASSETISNQISLSGNGNNNNGAINIVTPLTQLTLSGKVTLSGNTELGVYNYNNTNLGPGSFTFRSLSSNGYSISGLSSSITVNK